MTVTSIQVTHLQELARSSEAAHGLAPPGKICQRGAQPGCFWVGKTTHTGKSRRETRGVRKA